MILLLFIIHKSGYLLELEQSALPGALEEWGSLGGIKMGREMLPASIKQHLHSSAERARGIKQSILLPLCARFSHSTNSPAC